MIAHPSAVVHVETGSEDDSLPRPLGGKPGPCFGVTLLVLTKSRFVRCSHHGKSSLRSSRAKRRAMAGCAQNAPAGTAKHSAPPKKSCGLQDPLQCTLCDGASILRASYHFACRCSYRKTAKAVFNKWTKLKNFQWMFSKIV